jgi:HAD superfamily 5'-nucleotidase-like hydrolase
MTIYVNRTLNLKKIKAIGFDMDYTIVRYNSENFERFTHGQVLKKLVSEKNYPAEIEKLVFDFHLVIQGLIIDKKRGHLLKVSRFGKVKSCMFGQEMLHYKEQERLYGNRTIDLNDDWVQSLDTSFAISNGVVFAQLVELKKKGMPLPDYPILADDIKEVLDLAHSDGTLKTEVRTNFDDYIVKDPKIVETLERIKEYGKRLLLITNSDYNYTRLLLDNTITPFLKDHKHWSELFEVVVTLSGKPRFFNHQSGFLKVDASTGAMTNIEGKITPGIYQGGHAGKLQKDLGLSGDEILYLGDHIYGDVVTIKKTFNWRTALVLEPIADEVEAIRKGRPVQQKIDELMDEKSQLEHELNTLDLSHKTEGKKKDREKINALFTEIERINSEISDQLNLHRQYFNPHWGEMMRAGYEESRFADQVEKYACIYMARVSDLLKFSPKTYFRPHRRVLPHEIVDPFEEA